MAVTGTSEMSGEWVSAGEVQGLRKAGVLYTVSLGVLWNKTLLACAKRLLACLMSMCSASLVTGTARLCVDEPFWKSDKFKDVQVAQRKGRIHFGRRHFALAAARVGKFPLHKPGCDLTV